MAKFYGIVGFVTNQETSPGVHMGIPVERNYYGDVLENSRRLQASGQANDNIVITNRISIMADPYANENFHAIRYVVFMGARWKVETASAEYPRIVLNLGGVYNGKQA